MKDTETGLPDWDSCAKHFPWSDCPACERAKPKSRRDGRMWMFADSRVPLRSLFESLADGQTVDEFVEEHSVGRDKVATVIQFALSKELKGMKSRATNLRRKARSALHLSPVETSVLENRYLREARRRGSRLIVRLRKAAESEPVLKYILQIAEAMDTDSVYSVAAFLLSRNPDLGNKTALQLLKAGETERVMAEARIFLRHGA